jgi:hypothetical protein
MSAGLILAFLGYLLVYAGVKGVHPWAPIAQAFGAAPPAPPGGRNTGPGINPKTGGVFLAPGEVQGPPTEATGGLSRAAARAKEAIDRTYPDLAYLGGPSCRCIRPHDGGSSSVVSEHAEWPGGANAIDYGGPWALMSKLMVWANLPHNRLLFKINNVIAPVHGGIEAVHIDFLPSHSGQPCPCSGGCSGCS